MRGRASRIDASRRRPRKGDDRLTGRRAPSEQRGGYASHEKAAVTDSRDFVGYGRTPPQANWPDGARIAVQIVLNYEEGAENSILHGDAASEAFLSEVVGAQP